MRELAFCLSKGKIELFFSKIDFEKIKSSFMLMSCQLSFDISNTDILHLIKLYSVKFHVYKISGLQLQKMTKLLILKHGALIIDHPVLL